MKVDRVGKAEALEKIFQALPPFGSNTFLEHIRQAPKPELPAEVLVRAYRSVRHSSRSGRTILARLFGRSQGRWEYLGSVEAALGMLPITAQDREDSMMDGVCRMMEGLQTDRGRFAEVAWTQFCWHETVDAWRARAGWRGGRVLKQGPLTPSVLLTQENQVDKIERVMLNVLKSFTDPLLQKVACLAWLQDGRPKETGNYRADQPAPLVSNFPEHSPSQVRRALRAVDRALANALLAEPGLRWDKPTENWLEKVSGTENHA